LYWSVTDENLSLLRVAATENRLKVEDSPMNTKYIVVLSEAQRQHLEKLTSSGHVSARQIKRAQILLKSDVQVTWPYEQIRAAFDVSAVTIATVRRAFVEQGLEATLQRKKADRDQYTYQHAHTDLYPHGHRESVAYARFLKCNIHLRRRWKTGKIGGCDRPPYNDHLLCQQLL
jgi:hypothetical protein